MGKLTKVDEKFLQELGQHFGGYEDTEYVVTNPFTGASFSVNKTIWMCIKFIQDLSYSGFSDLAIDKYGLKRTNVVSKFDRARHIVLKLDSKVYMEILD